MPRTMTQLEKQYGGKRRNAVNRAIRAECRGGAALLDAMKLLDNVLICDLPPDLQQRLTLVMSGLNAARNSMESEVMQ